MRCILLTARGNGLPPRNRTEPTMQRLHLPRRRFLQHALAGASAAIIGCTHRNPPSRPNILFCISDDQSYPHASAYGATYLSTPAFDRVAHEGVLFHNCYVSTPSCCPSRSSVLTGHDFYRLRETSMNHTVWPGGLDVYPDVLAEAGYHAGFTGKGWGPGNWEVSGRSIPPAGREYNEITLQPPGASVSDIDYAANFQAFLDQRPAGAPFCFWAGFIEPHRPFDAGIGVRHGKKIEDMPVPDFLPDSPEVRSDIADYAFEIEHYDHHLGRMLDLLEQRGELDNTIVIATGDDAWPSRGQRLPCTTTAPACRRPSAGAPEFSLAARCRTLSASPTSRPPSMKPPAWRFPPRSPDIAWWNSSRRPPPGRSNRTAITVCSASSGTFPEAVPMAPATRSAPYERRSTSISETSLRTRTR